VCERTQVATGLPLSNGVLRIERVQNGAGETTLRATGRLAGPWLGELERSVDVSLAAGSAVLLDLSDVSFVDREGIELLRSLRRLEQVNLRCSAFVAEQINTDRSVRL
jgi:anti-anti-sigma regulatory factor